jgi:predicted  nucleic acid-binding Zn-ribbon protein
VLSDVLVLLAALDDARAAGIKFRVKENDMVSTPTDLSSYAKLIVTLALDKQSALARELEHVRAERDAADRACAALEREVEELRQQLAQADADNAGLIQRLRRLQSAADGR